MAMHRKLFALLKRFLKSFWGSLSHNLGLKLLSLLFAVLLWSYVVSSNPSITRHKLIGDIDAYVTNQSVLNDVYNLALAEDPSGKLKDVSVRLEVPQASYALANAENVQVTLDLASVRAAGTQEVPLKATVFGRVVRTMPESITLNFEALDSRSIPVNVVLTGEQDESMWYNVSRKNPGELVISGASGVVQSIESAYVYTDVTDREQSFVTAGRFVLLDHDGSEVPQALLKRTSTSVTVSVDVYPKKELPVSNKIADAVKGSVADGFEVTGITIQPETATVAAAPDVLEGLTELLVEPVALNGARQSFSQRTKISRLTDFKNVSPEQVYVNIQIEEEVVSALLTDVRFTFVNKPEDMTVSWRREEFSVRVTGPKSRVDQLRQAGVSAVVDLAGLAAGEHKLPLTVEEGMYPGITFEFEPANVSLTLDGAPKTD
jgi:YbbR domain-containing protein